MLVCHHSRRNSDHALVLLSVVEPIIGSTSKTNPRDHIDHVVLLGRQGGQGDRTGPDEEGPEQFLLLIRDEGER